MIVDLQGVNNVLTDPQIHCTDKSKFGKGNLSYEGILMFFNSHQCNTYCKYLGLVHPKDTDGQLPNNFSLFNQSEEPSDPDTYIQKLCDLCRHPFKIQYYRYREQRDKSMEMYCDGCNRKRSGSMKQGVCCMCQATFKSSVYWFRMKKTDFPDKCSGCRLKNRERMRKELESQKGKEGVV